MAAHGDTGTLELVEAVPEDADSVTYAVRLTYENDGDPVSGKEVFVVTDNVAPQAMTSEGDGVYTATVDFPSPGDYSVLFTVEEPEAELAVDQVVTTTTTTAAPDDEVTTTVGVRPTNEQTPLTSGGADQNDANGTWLLIVMAVIVVAMVTLAIAFLRGRASASKRPST